MSIRRRVYTRHTVSLRVYIHIGDDWVEGATVDVSRGGMFVQIPRLLEVGETAQIRAEMLDGRMLKLGGTIRRVVRKPPPGQPGPGLAIELTDVTVVARARWEDFVLRVGGEAKSNVNMDDDGAGATAPRRKSSMTTVRDGGPHIVARPRNADELRAVQRNLLRHGRLHLRSKAPCKPGDDAVVVIIHPDSDGEFTLSGTVDRMVQDDRGLRVGLRITVGEIVAETRADLARFVAHGRVTAPAEQADGMAALRRACIESPGEGAAFSRLAWAMLLDQGEVTNAATAFRRALELNPADLDACWGLALTSALLDDGEGALRLAARAHARKQQS